MTREIEDPDFGRIELPEPGRVPPRAWEAPLFHRGTNRHRFRRRSLPDGVVGRLQASGPGPATSRPSVAVERERIEVWTADLLAACDKLWFRYGDPATR
jgi:hypothetical protein